jgi:hypothetical protein
VDELAHKGPQPFGHTDKYVMTRSSGADGCRSQCSDPPNACGMIQSGFVAFIAAT